MGLRLANVFRLGIKELYSLRADPILLVMIVYAFTFAVYSTATGAKSEVENVAVGIVDEDDSELSRRIAGAILEPLFRPAVQLMPNEIDPGMNSGRFVFVLEIPPKFESDVLAGRGPTVQIDVDATALTQAGVGASYLQNIIESEASGYLQHGEGAITAPINLVTRTAFNPNHYSEWFLGIMAEINNITMLTVVLTGAALIREREHGTIEHLLVMPVTSAEIMIAKIWANGLVIVVVAILSLWCVVHGLLRVPLVGSVPLFLAGTVLYEISVAALGILLATFTGTMGQFGLLVVPVLVILNLLSGSATPPESMPDWLIEVMKVAPTPHFVSFAQGVLYRAAGFELVWPQLAALAGITVCYFSVSLIRFRKAITSFQ
ncbi:MAG: ABC transporter permease [Rhodopila sp.]|nr:ABC transporter permease [Rhodopila sp.]